MKKGEAVPVPEERYMTREEVLLDNLEHPRRLVRLTGSEWNHPRGAYNFDSKIDHYDYIDIPENYKGDLSELEVKQYKKRTTYNFDEAWEIFSPPVQCGECYVFYDARKEKNCPICGSEEWVGSR